MLYLHSLCLSSRAHAIVSPGRSATTHHPEFENSPSRALRNANRTCQLQITSFRVFSFNMPNALQPEALLSSANASAMHSGTSGISHRFLLNFQSKTTGTVMIIAERIPALIYTDNSNAKYAVAVVKGTAFRVIISTSLRIAIIVTKLSSRCLQVSL